MAKEGARKEERAAAAAQVSRARGAVQEVNSYIHETVQIAQVEGEVSDIYPNVGELVGTGSPIMSISVMSDMWGTFNVREDQLSGREGGFRIHRIFASLQERHQDEGVLPQRPGQLRRVEGHEV